MERLSKPAQAGLVGEEGEAAFLDEGVAPEPKVFNQREEQPSIRGAGTLDGPTEE